jgi:lysophospholipase L1-like esterase
MTTRRGGISALSLHFCENRCDQARGRRTRKVLFASLVSCLVAGCLPGQDRASDSTSAATKSNHAAKAGRLDRGGGATPPDMRVETTATVIPTSAPDPGNALPAARPPAPADEALGRFFDALAALDRGGRQKPVTIVHIGDQHIAADRITATLREQFQRRFGNAGRGLMPPGVFRVAGARITRNGDWRIASSARGDSGPFGLTGLRLTGREGATLQLATPEAPFDWAEVTFATGPETGEGYVGVGESGDVVSTRTAEPTWQRIRINAGGSTLTVRAEGAAPVQLLSWRLMRDSAGVRYVNLGVPGATMETAERWTDAFFKADIQHLSPDLIVIGYGTNAAFDDQLDPEAYITAADTLIARLRSAAPNASLLLVGPPDVARLPSYAARDGSHACRALTAEERVSYAGRLQARSPRLARWHPPLKLRAVKRALQVVASRERAFFWDWAKAMGGPCGIHAWVHASPPLAAEDHRNFTAEGARKSARMLFRDLMEAYEGYRVTSASARN